MAELLMNLMAATGPSPPLTALRSKSIKSSETLPRTSIGAVIPDLSHLNENERPIIESVILRQRKEEEEEAQLLKHKQNEVLLLEELIRKRNEEHLRYQGNVDLDATCQICLKTKFADGIGHCCNYCNTKCCARCGGKVTLRSNKNIWACIVCRKKQELLIKTGQWIHSSKNAGLKQSDTVAATPTTETPLLERILNFGSANNTESKQPQPLRSSLNFIRRNSLGMFPSFSSINSNVTPVLSSSITSTVQKPRLLKRQLSHEPTTNTLNYLGLHKSAAPLPQSQLNKSRQWLSNNQTVEQQFKEDNFTGIDRSAPKRHILPRQPSLPISHQFLPSSQVLNQSQPALMLQPKKVPLESSQIISSEACTTTTGHSQLTTGSGRKLPTQRQKSRELPSLNDIVLMQTQFQEQQQQSSLPSKLPIHTIKKLPQLPDRSNNPILKAPIKTTTASSAINTCVPSGSSSTPNIALPISQHANNQLSSSYSRSYSGGDTTIANTSGNVGILNQRMFLSAGSLIRNDSIGSDPGDIRKSTPPPSAFVRQLPSTNQRLRLRDHLIMHHVYHRSFSSSEDNTDGGCGGGTRSLTPELSTEDDFDLFDSCESSGIVSGDGKQLSANSLLPPRQGRLLPRSIGSTSATLKCEDILDSKMKNFLVHPITWEKSADGTQMVCRMTLKKNCLPDSGLSSSAMLGMKIVGGRIIEAGRIGAIVEKVKKGSIADTIGRLKPRDEVLEWNNISLKGKTYDEVHDIIADSKHHTQIDLVVARPLPETISGSSHGKSLLRCPLVQTSAASRDELLIQQQNKRIGRRHTDVISSTAQPRSLDIVDKNAFFTRGSSLGAECTARQMRTTPYLKVTRSPTITGRIQVKLYYDGQTLELFVTIMNAIDLSPRKTGLLRNPYCTIYLLPDQTEKTLRKTSTVINTLEPIWNQTFQYSPLSSQDIRTRALELTVCDYDHFLSVEFLGATIIELQHVQMDDEPEWYCLTTREDLQQQLRQQLMSTYKLSAETSTGTSGVGGCGLSPPTHSATSISARLSDSDVASELSMDDFDSKADSWRCLLADTSQSGSIGSGGSGSSPPLGVSSMDTLGMGDMVSGGTSVPGGRRFRAYLQQPAANSNLGNNGSLSYHHYHHFFHPRNAHLSSASTATTSTNVLHHPKIYHTSGQQQQSFGDFRPLSTANQPQSRQYRNLPFPLSVSSLANSSNVYSGSIAISNSSTSVTMVTPINSNVIIPPSNELRKGSLQLIGTKTSNQNKLVSQSSLNYPSSGSKKRHLPMLPNMAATFGGSARSMDYLQQEKSIDQLTPPLDTMYSDSEITIRPVFGNRPLYAHPVTSMPTSRRYHALQQQQSISLDDVDYYRSPKLAGTIVYQQSTHEVQSESELSSSGHNRSQQQASYLNQPPSNNQQHCGRHRSLMVSSTVDYRELKDYNNRRTSYHQADVDADGEDDETEFDDDKEGQYRNHRSRHYYRKESNGSRRESMPKGELSSGNNNNVAGVHHRSSIHRKNSRRKREQQQPPASEQDGDDSEEETESSSAHNRLLNNNRQYLQNQPSISSQQLQQPFDLIPSTQPGALPSRPKGSRTLSEFTSHRGQQHSAPVHPPHPSRSSLAVARSLSERSKEDKSLESSFSDVPAIGGPKSYSDQIDEVMEQLNANCDFSMDDLFNDANSASASNYNVQQTADGKGGKKKMPHSQTGLTKKSNSASQLSVTGTKKRLGFRKNKQQTSFSVHRSEEVLPDEVRHLVKQYSSLSSDGEGSVSGESSSIAAWMPATPNRSNNPTQTTTSGEGEFSNFVEGLGPGQIVGRQALAASNLGDIQLSLHDRKGHLEVEVIRARGLQSTKQKSKIIPAPFVKVYMLRNGKCVYKAKTQMARRTLDPLFQQQLLFSDNYKGCILHVVVNGLYGRMDKKFFMGAVQIVLDDLDLTNIVIGWYKLFNESSAISLPQSSKGGSSGGSGGGLGGVGSGGSISGATSLMSASMESFN